MIVGETTDILTNQEPVGCYQTCFTLIVSSIVCVVNAIFLAISVDSYIYERKHVKDEADASQVVWCSILTTFSLIATIAFFARNHYFNTVCVGMNWFKI